MHSKVSRSCRSAGNRRVRPELPGHWGFTGRRAPEPIPALLLARSMGRSVQGIGRQGRQGDAQGLASLLEFSTEPCRRPPNPRPPDRESLQAGAGAGIRRDMPDHREIGRKSLLDTNSRRILKLASTCEELDVSKPLQHMMLYALPLKWT